MKFILAGAACPKFERATDAAHHSVVHSRARPYGPFFYTQTLQTRYISGQQQADRSKGARFSLREGPGDFRWRAYLVPAVITIDRIRAHDQTLRFTNGDNYGF